MKKTFKFGNFLLMLPLFTMHLVACSDDDSPPSHKPTVTINEVTATINDANFKFTVDDAEYAVYKVVNAEEEAPTAEQLLADQTAHVIDLNTPAGSVTHLNANTDYLVVAAAKYGETQSALARKSFRTGVITVTYDFQSAVGGYQGRIAEKQVAAYVVDFSTRPYDDSTLPVTHLYVALTGDADKVDLKNLTIPTGTFAAGDTANPEAGKFYPGAVNGNDAPYNSFIAFQESAVDPIGVDLIAGGELTIREGSNKGQYEADIHFTLEDGTKIEGTYQGALVVDNESGELPPPEVLPLKASSLSSDATDLQIQEVYYSYFGSTRYGIEGKDEIYLSCYVDAANYSELFDIFLLVDNGKYPGDRKLPAGIYPIREWDNMSSPDKLVSLAGFQVEDAAGMPVILGCWYTRQIWTDGIPKTEDAPMVEGQVEVISCDTDMNAELELTFKDNAVPAHTVTATFKGQITVF